MLIYVSCVYGMYLAYLSEMTKPFMEKYTISEWKADLFVSLFDLGAVILSPILGVILTYIGRGRLVHFNLAGVTNYIVYLIFFYGFFQH